ncbi:MAG: polysaccharide deacetylase [Lachnospiraceae bacterium]|nr:polysaccharide deacetylase [Lachnospiraceae bacterium]
MESNGFDISFKRRNRGKSMRVAMITLLVTLIVVPTTLCVVLLFRISSLQNEINELMESHSVVADNNSSTDGALSDGETTSSTEEQSSTDEITTEIPTETTTVEPLPDGKYAYLTFDDGPSANTEAILDVLDQYGVKATFFVNGHTGSTMEARYKAIVDRGHALGIHTYTHKYDSVYGGIESFANEVESLRKYLYDITGVDVRLFRFPGGSSNTIVDDITPYIQWINDNGYSYHDWNCSSGDADSKKPTAQQIIDNCMVQVDQGYRNLVILMHDTKSKDTTVEALPMLIEKLLENGYEIRAIDERSVPVHHREIEAE